MPKIPPEFWIVLFLAVLAAQPLRHVIRHLTHSSRGKDITAPPEDLSWRTQRALIRSLAILAIALSLGIFVFMPSAARLAQSPYIPGLFGFVLGAGALVLVAHGLRSGRTFPLIKGLTGRYERTQQPARYWLSTTYNAVVGTAMISSGVAMTADARVNLCVSSISEAVTSEAIAACDRAVSSWFFSDTQKVRAHAALAYHHLERGENSAALEELNAAVGLAPDDAGSRATRGLLLILAGELEMARRDYRVAVSLDPEVREGILERANANLEANQRDMAIADLTGLLLVEPENVTALTTRGLAYHRDGQPALSRKDVDLARKIRPDDPLVVTTMARIAIENGEFQTAIAILDRHISLHPKDIKAVKERSTAYWKAGMEDESRRDDDRAWELQDQQAAAAK